MTVSDPLIIANCNTLAETARNLANNGPVIAALDGERITETGVSMCLNLIAETCDMLTMLNDWSIEVDEFPVESSLFVIDMLTKAAKAVKVED